MENIIILNKETFPSLQVVQRILRKIFPHIINQEDFSDGKDY